MIEALTTVQRAALRTALAPFAESIERVDLYGSRARGDHRPGSDVDLLLTGPIDLQTLLQIASAIDASDLSIYADITLQRTLTGALADAVRREARLLFTKVDLAVPVALAGA